ncbi:MAG: hypothetical protein NZ553_02585 [Caldilinea sp.]|nr:hypothetical protein [Caldilinea sp.]MDW8439337.1 hypothetical protein [Caldilineaceae bacterium]
MRAPSKFVMLSERQRRFLAGGLTAAVLLLAALPALWPLLQLGLTQSADGMLHVLRIALLTIHQSEGVFYPRWMPDLVLGYGYPLLAFYGPATYYLAGLFVFLGFTPASALALTFATLLLLAGAGTYLLAYDLWEGMEGRRRRAAAMVSAIAYLYAPYLLLNVYARGAVAEVGAQALLPWILWFLRRIFYAANPTSAGLGFALSAALLALTHNISLILMPPMIALYAVAVTLQARSLPWPLPSRLGVAAAASAAALGASAFFWAPLLLERSLLAPTAFAIAARYVGENTWAWSNFLDSSIPFTYSTAIPFRLGIVQLALAIVGFAATPRRSVEWWMLAAITLGAALMVSALALPLWLNSDVLLIAQFPWRMLAVISLPLAIFPAGIVARIRPRWAAMAGAAALIALILVGQRPITTAFTPLLEQPTTIGRPAVAQFEFQTHAYGTSSSSEFLPRWAGGDLFGDAAKGDEIEPAPEIHLEIGSPIEMRFAVTTSLPIDLKIANFYFPGWSATIDEQATALHPDVARGMQTVTVPAGTHSIAIRNVGNSLYRATTWVSLTTLAALVIGVWIKGANRRRLAAVPALCLAVGLYTALQPVPQPGAWLSTHVDVGDGALELLGVRYQVEEDRFLHLFPYWFVRSSMDGRIHWRLVDAEGRAATSASGDAFFNTVRLASIPARTLFDDAYQLALPPGLGAGEYMLEVAVAAPGETPIFAAVGALRLSGVPKTESPSMQPLHLRFGSSILLDGWSARVDGRPASDDTVKMLVLRPGQTLEYTFYWRAEDVVDENYHGFVHLLDHTKQAVLQYDKTAGSLSAPSRLWNAFYPQPDGYRLVIGEETPGGLYHPIVGLYRFGDGQRLPIIDAEGQSLGTELALPPVKVVVQPKAAPSQKVNVRVGDWGELQGFTMAPDTATVAPGDVLTLTLFYRADGPAPLNYTRFIHVHNPVLGMAAQQDAPPLNGGNPTSSWVTGEQIVETVALTVPHDVQEGEYTVWFGMYDPASGERAMLRNATGQPLPDNRFALAGIAVER